MAETVFNLDGYLNRIGYAGTREASLPALRGMIAAHSASIPFENIDPFLGRAPKLDVASLQAKMVASRRGGYCFEHNALLRAGLIALGFDVTSLVARVVLGGSADAFTPATHMILRVDLPEGPFLADVGFGHQTATLPLRLQPGLEQQTLHEAMRLRPASEELVLEARLAGCWQHLYRFSLRPTPDIDYEVGNWFCATYPGLFTENLIVARAGAERMRHTFLNGRVTVRRDGEVVERRVVEGERALAVVLAEPFLLTLPDEGVAALLRQMSERGILGASNPIFG